ncbi:MAG: hypothetical protein JL50_09860 [Peptococcaceae bacterium BICA1-7]|nr:MAG: hypothetical protein JL50_09860 [Peptococcaceae bacterium BICA1-7]HBV95587.1 hypothetical protein [Desulfotomaculum sp.]
MACLYSQQEFLASLGAGAGEVAELLEYNKSVFKSSPGEDRSFPLADEPFVEAWAGYVREAGEAGAWNTLHGRFIQLDFPVSEGISLTENYRAATLRGTPIEGMTEARGLGLECPGELQISMYQTPAGKIPVLVAGHRPDFVRLVQAFTARNEPENIPASMGACLVSGYNNWDRIRSYRKKWLGENPSYTEIDWQEEFKSIIPRKELYRDTFIILSRQEYSGVPAGEMGLGHKEWLDMSLTIRREHEATHYFTRRVLGSARNNILDELIADCMGIMAAAGNYRPDWFLLFMGLEGYPRFREGGRLANYMGSPPLSPGAFIILQTLVKRASEYIEHICRQYMEGKTSEEAKLGILLFLTGTTIIDLASGNVSGTGWDLPE